MELRIGQVGRQFSRNRCDSEWHFVGVSAVKGLQGCGYVCNGYQW